MGRSKSKHQSRRQHGMSLIEVLVAVVVLTIGALGMAGLQMRALKGGQSSLQRSQAVILANYMLDVIRTDRVNAQAYAMGLTCAAPNASNRITTAQNKWITDLKVALSNDDSTCGQVACVASGNDTLCTVTIQWNDSGSGGSNTQTISTSSRL